MTDHQQVREALELAFEETDSCIVANKCQKALAALSRLEAAAAAEYERGRQDGMKQEHAMWKLAQAGQEIEAAALPELSREDVVRLAERFHEAYERLAPSFGYETRTETRKFDPATSNGKLMIAVCSEIVRSVPVGSQS